MANIDLGNLTRYDGKIKQYTEDKYLSKNTANWQMTEKAGAVTCYPVPDTELEPIVDFSFKEVSPVEGDKGPINPSTITGVSSIVVTRCGKNIVRDLQTNTVRGVVFTVNQDGSITVDRISSDSSPAFYSITPLKTLKTGLTYSLSGCPSGGSLTTFLQRFGNKTSPVDIGSGITEEILASLDMSKGFIRIDSSCSPDSIIFWPQIELSNEITSFEKSEYEDYTYSLGNTYYGGKVNLATGEMTVTHQVDNITSCYIIDAFSGFTQTETTAAAFVSVSQIPDHSINPVSSNMFEPGNSNTGYNQYGWRGSDISKVCKCSFSKSSLSLSGTVTAEQVTTAVNALLTETPLEIVYKLATPYIVQLTPMQIKSLFALDKNTPRLNTLYTDADSIQVGYQKHPARTAYELENAILALGGGE